MGENDKQLKVIFTLIAAVYVIVQYRINIYNQRVAQAAEYFVVRDRDKELEAQFGLGQFLENSEYVDFLNSVQAKPAEQRSDDYKKGLPVLIRRAGEQKDIYTIVRFYRDIDLCVKASDCDQATICKFFFNDLQNFREYYRPILESSGDASEIKDLAEGECSANFVTYCSAASQSPYCADGAGTPSPTRGLMAFLQRFRR